MGTDINIVIEAKRVLAGREWYEFSELSPAAKQRALDNFYVCDNWHDGILEQLTSMLEDVGVYGADIQYSGFSSQGDGAMFTGEYRYAKGALAKYKRDWPKDTKLHSCLKALVAVQRRWFYRLSATITKPGRYFHEYEARVECNVPEAEKDLTEALHDLMRYCYTSLEEEYEYLRWGEGAVDCIEGNDYVFNKDGSDWEGDRP